MKYFKGLGILILLAAGVEFSSFLIMKVISSTEAGKVWDSKTKDQRYTDFNWMTGFNSYHPFLGYKRRRTHFSKKKENTYRIGVLGGSVSEIFGDYLLRNRMSDLKEALSAKLKSRKLEVVNLATGGHKQPNQLISSVLYYDDVDLFISFEGINELFSRHSVCRPIDWPQLIHSWDPELDSIYKRLAGVARLGFNFMYYLEDSSYFLRASLYFSGNFLKTLLDRLQILHLSAVRGSCVEKPGDYSYSDQDYMQSWFLNIKKQQKIIVGSGKPVLTILQPYQYLPGSKPWSKEEAIIFEGARKRDRKHAGDLYAKAREGFNKIAKDHPHLIDFSYIFVDQTETLYTDSCCHFNARGNQIIYEELIPLIIKNVK